MQHFCCRHFLTCSARFIRGLNASKPFITHLRVRQCPSEWHLATFTRRACTGFSSRKVNLFRVLAATRSEKKRAIQVTLEQSIGPHDKSWNPNGFHGLSWGRLLVLHEATASAARPGLTLWANPLGQVPTLWSRTTCPTG